MIRPPELGCLHRAHQRPHGIHVDEPKERGRNKSREKTLSPQADSKQVRNLRFQSLFTAQGCAFVARLCCLSHTTTLPQAREDSLCLYRCFLTAVTVRENQVLYNHPKRTLQEFLNCPTKISVLVPPLTQRKEEGVASCSKLHNRQSQQYKIIGIILVCLA